MSEYTILFQGDSITDCGREKCGGAGFDCHGLGPGYPGMIAARLQCDRPETDWKFINLGISGNRIVDLYARWKIDCINLRPDLVSILVGVNDTWHEFHRANGVEVPRYARIYRELLQWTRQELPEVKFVLMDPFLLPEVEDRSAMVPDVAARREVVAELAAEFGAVHLELQKLFDTASERAPQAHWSADGVHPTPAGQQLIADAWIAAVSKTFPSFGKGA